MSDCPPTEWGPCAPYLDPAGVEALGCVCSGLDLGEPADVEAFERALWWATRRLFEASGGRWTGCCEETVRPVSQPCRDVGSIPVEFADRYLPAIPHVVGEAAPGVPRLVNCWTCPSPAGAGTVLALPLVPVRAIVEVRIDGAVLDPAAYRLRPGTNLLVRIDGAPWPTSQAIDLDDDQPGTWSVTWTWGLDLPPEAAPLLAGFACELLTLCRTGSCGLSPGVRVVSRPGVEFDDVVIDGDLRDRSLTGFGPLDDWLLSMRGGHTTIEPRAYVPRATW